jgi:hypothetical protein
MGTQWRSKGREGKGIRIEYLLRKIQGIVIETSIFGALWWTLNQRESCGSHESSVRFFVCRMSMAALWQLTYLSTRRFVAPIIGPSVSRLDNRLAMSRM